jgi:hypothetical protein
LKIPFQAYLRPSGSTNSSTYSIDASWLTIIAPSIIPGPVTSVNYQNDHTDDWYSIYAVNVAGVRVAVGIHDSVIDQNVRTGVFNNVAGVDIDYIEIVFNTPDNFGLSNVNAFFGGGICGTPFNTYTSNVQWFYTDAGIQVVGSGTVTNAPLYYAAGAGLWVELGFAVPNVNRLVKITGFVNDSYSNIDCVKIGFMHTNLINNMAPIYTVPGSNLPVNGLMYYWNSYNIGDLFIGASIYAGPAESLHNMNLLAYLNIDPVPTKAINMRTLTLWNVCKNIKNL